MIGLLILALDGKANDLMLLVAGSITTLLVVGTAAFVAIIGSERRIHLTFTAITRFINAVISFVTRHKGDAISTERAEGIVQDLHVNYKTIESRWRELKAPLLWAAVVNLSAILAIYCVYAAFGSWVNLGAIIVAYSVANFAGLISVLPGGAGIYEALMVGVLVAGGIPAALSLPVTVMWRVLTTLIQLPRGTGCIIITYGVLVRRRWTNQMNPDVVFTVSEFVAVLNQTLEYAYPSVTVTGELANFRVSKTSGCILTSRTTSVRSSFSARCTSCPGRWKTA